MRKTSSLKFNSLVTYPRVQMAAYTGNMMSTVDKVIDGKCSFLNAYDVSKLSNKLVLPSLEKAELLMEQARELCQKYNVPIKWKSQQLLAHDARLLYHIIGKGKSSRYNCQHASLEEAAQAFLKELCNHTNDEAVLAVWGLSLIHI